jgi:hypothetical protein
VKRWRSASMAMRWTAAAMQEAAKGFRRLKAHKQLPALGAAQDANQNKTHMAFLLAKPTPHNVNHDNDRFSMFKKNGTSPDRKCLRGNLRKPATVQGLPPAAPPRLLRRPAIISKIDVGVKRVDIAIILLTRPVMISGRPAFSAA